MGSMHLGIVNANRRDDDGSEFEPGVRPIDVVRARALDAGHALDIAQRVSEGSRAEAAVLVVRAMGPLDTPEGLAGLLEALYRQLSEVEGYIEFRRPNTKQHRAEVDLLAAVVVAYGSEEQRLKWFGGAASDSKTKSISAAIADLERAENDDGEDEEVVRAFEQAQRALAAACEAASEFAFRAERASGH